MNDNKRESEDEVWEYGPKKKQKVATGNRPRKLKDIPPRRNEPVIAHESYSSSRNSNKKSKSSKTYSKSRSKPTKTRHVVSKSPALKNVDENSEMENMSASKCRSPFLETSSVANEGNCPICQLPYKFLRLESPRWHTMECMDLPIIAQEECPDGVDCASSALSHYRQFRHSLLTQIRAGFKSPSSKGSRVKARCVKQLSFHSTKDGQSENVHVKQVIKPEPLSPRNVAAMELKDDLEQLKYAKCEDDSHDQLLHDDDVNNVNEPLSQHVDNATASSLHYDEPNDNSKTISHKINQEHKHDVLSCLQNEPQYNHISQGGVDLSECDDADMLQNDASQSQPERDQLQCGVEANHGDTVNFLKDISFRDDFSESDEDIFSKASQSTEQHPESFSQTVSTQDAIELASPLKRSKSAPVTVPQQKPKSSKKLTKAQSSCKGQSSLLSFFKSKDTTTPSTQTDVNSDAKSSSTESHKDSSSFDTINDQASVSTKQITGSKPAVFPIVLKSKVAESAKSSGLDNSTKSNRGNQKRDWGSRANRPCPFYKKITGTSFVVDAFSFGVIPGCTAYFLSHFHYDHYIGLTKPFSETMYCSKVTANLVKKQIRVSDEYIHALDLNTPYVIDGVEVTLLDANHCPGSVLFLFRLRNGVTHLHTGDFRASKDMEKYPELLGTHINSLYLDTTYCDPSYAFPSQKEVVAFGVNLASKFMSTNPNGIIVAGSYTIGKERIFLAIADALSARICVTREKKNILDCLEDESVSRKITLAPHDARVHVVPMRQLNYPSLSEYLGKLKPRFDAVLAIEPTGWTHKQKKPSLHDIKPKFSRDGISLYGLPYSEHSSFLELKAFVQFTKPEKIIPTVNNGSAESRAKMTNIFSCWKSADSGKKELKQSQLGNWCS